MMDLGAYLKAAAATPWTPGRHDCSAWPARWAGVDFPTYSTDAEGEALIDAAGGLVELWASLIRGKLDRTDDPRAGDIGIIAVIGSAGEMLTGAIHTGKRWAFVTPQRLAVVSAEPVAAWRVSCRS